MICKVCGASIGIGVQYDVSSRYYYDGDSEHVCDSCGTRFGAFCGLALRDGEKEPPNCKGHEHHPMEITVTDESL